MLRVEIDHDTQHSKAMRNEMSELVNRLSALWNSFQNNRIGDTYW